MVADVSDCWSRFRVLCMENVHNTSIESYTVIWRAFLARSTVVAGGWWSLLVSLSRAIRSTMLGMSLLNRFALRIHTPTTIVLQALNRRVGPVLATFRYELYFRSLRDRIRSWRHTCIWIGKDCWGWRKLNETHSPLHVPRLLRLTLSPLHWALIRWHRDAYVFPSEPHTGRFFDSSHSPPLAAHSEIF